MNIVVYYTELTTGKESGSLFDDIILAAAEAVELEMDKKYRLGQIRVGDQVLSLDDIRKAIDRIVIHHGSDHWHSRDEGSVYNHTHRRGQTPHGHHGGRWGGHGDAPSNWLERDC